MKVGRVILQSIGIVRLEAQGMIALLLFGFAFTAGAEQMMRARPAPAAAQSTVVAPAGIPPAPSQGGGMAQLKPAAANAPTVMQPAVVMAAPLAPTNLSIQEVNPTISKLTWNYPDGNLQRNLTAIEWSLCVGPGDNCPIKTKAGPPQININDKNLGSFLGFPFEKIKNGSAVVGVKMCYLNAMGSGCARIDVPKPAMATMPGFLPQAKAPTPNVGVMQKGFKSGPSVPSVAALNSGAINTAVVAEPMTVNFGSVFSGDSRRAVVRVVSPRDGKVTVALAPNSPFSIADVKVFGMAETKSAGATSNQMLKKSPAPQQLKAAGPSAAPTLVSNFSRSLLATSASAPFTVATREGNELVVSLVFAPKFDLFNGLPVGGHNTTLAFDGGMWKTSVPVSGRFEGLKIGLIAVMSNSDIIEFTGKTGAVSDAELVLTNADKQAVSAQISAKQLPPGFAMSQVNVQIPAGQTAKVTLPITASTAMVKGAQQTAELTVSYSGTTKTVPFTFSVYPPDKEFQFSGEDGLEWEFGMRYSNTGLNYYQYRVTNMNYIAGREYTFTIRWKGMSVRVMQGAVGVKLTANNHNVMTFANYYQDDVVRDNYVQMLQEAPTVTMTYVNK